MSCKYLCAKIKSDKYIQGETKMNISLFVLALMLSAWQSYRLDQALRKVEELENRKIVWPSDFDEAKWLEKH
jgi:hypothetical protein